MIENFFKNRNQFLNQKPFKTFIQNLNEHSNNQIDNIILKFDKKYLLNLKKEMVVNLLKYNVDGDWAFRLKESEKFKKNGFSLEACKVRYGDIGIKIYQERCEKVKTKKENYSETDWKKLCDNKKSNLGLEGYIKKYGELEGTVKWNDYFNKWRIGIDKRKKEGWKNGRSLDEYQEKHGMELGFKKWKSIIDKRKYTLSLEGFINKYGDIVGKSLWQDYCKSNDKTSLKSFIKRHGEEIGKEKFQLMIEKIFKYFKNCKCYSKISQELFFYISKKLKNDIDVKYATKNGEEYMFVNENFCRGMFVDFKCGNIIIEFYGDFWHANPFKYKENDIVKHPNYNRFAKEIWNEDKQKVDWLKQKGYNVLIIWESNYIENKQKIINQCVDFINQNYNKNNVII